MTIKKEACLKKVYEANMFRGLSLFFIFNELKKKMDAREAADLMFDGIFKAGKLLRGMMGVSPEDLSAEQFREKLFGAEADSQYLFKPEVLEEKEDQFTVKLHDCAVRAAWKMAGASPEEVRQMCRIGDAMTFGMIDGGFKLITTYPESHTDLCVYCFKKI